MIFNGNILMLCYNRLFFYSIANHKYRTFETKYRQIIRTSIFDCKQLKKKNICFKNLFLKIIHSADREIGIFQFLSMNY